MRQLSLLVLAGVVCGSLARATEPPTTPGNGFTPTPAKLSDWANLDRYHKENLKLPPPAPGERRVVFLGDAITEKWKTESPSFFEGKPYINRGIADQSTAQMSLRFGPDVVALKPKAVVILGGSVDIADSAKDIALETAEESLMSMAELAEQTGIRVLFATLPPVSDAMAPKTSSASPAKIDTLNRWIKSYASAHGHTVIDFYTALKDEKQSLKRELTADGIHPNAAGYALMERLTESALAATVD